LAGRGTPFCRQAAHAGLFFEVTAGAQLLFEKFSGVLREKVF
jgi:hypothetical protein